MTEPNTESLPKSIATHRLSNVGSGIWCVACEQYSGAELDGGRVCVQALRRELDHLRESVGDDSCADYVIRNARLEAELTSVRQELTDIGNAAVDGFLIGHVFRPHKPTEPLREARTPYTREELDQLRADVDARPARPVSPMTTSRLLATIEQRDRIYAAIRTDADPAGTIREVVMLRDRVAQLEAKIAEMGDR